MYDEWWLRTVKRDGSEVNVNRSGISFWAIKKGINSGWWVKLCNILINSKQIGVYIAEVTWNDMQITSAMLL